MKENQKKDLNYYKKLEYQIKIEKESYKNEKWYVAFCDELGRFSCYGSGATQQEALQNFLDDKDEFIELLFRKKSPIPEPRLVKHDTVKFSGVFNLRTTPELHGLLSQQAKDSSVSLNLYVNQLLAFASAFHEAKVYFDEKCIQIEDKIDAHHYQMANQIFDYKKDNLEKERSKYIVQGDFINYEQAV